MSMRKPGISDLIMKLCVSHQFGRAANVPSNVCFSVQLASQSRSVDRVFYAIVRKLKIITIEVLQPTNEFIGWRGIQLLILPRCLA